MALRSTPWVLAAAIGVMGATPAMACEAHKDQAAQDGKIKACACKACACGEKCACPGRKAKREGKRHGEHKGQRYHAVARTAEVRFLPATGAAASQHLILGGGPRMRISEGFSIGYQRNLGIQLFPQGPAGAWVTPYGGVLPRMGTSFGPGSVHVGALLGAGAMLRTTGVPNVGGDFLQARLMWVAEPRLELGWEAKSYRGALVGTYLLTPNMGEFGGATVGLQFSFKGHPFKHW